METLRNIIIYFLKKYPNPAELSKPRLVKLIYLADWKYSIEKKSQITNINWFYNHFGPYVEEVINYIKQDTSSFDVTSTINAYGGSSDKIRLKDNVDFDESLLSKDIKETLDFVIEKTYNLGWSNFISLVYSTYPIQNSPQYSNLDLPKMAEEYIKNR